MTMMTDVQATVAAVAAAAAESFGVAGLFCLA